MDRQVRPVEERQEGPGRRVLVVGVDELLGLLEALLRPLRLRVAAGLDEVEVGRGDQQVGRRLVRDRATDEVVRLLAERQAVLRLRRAGLALGVVEGPLVERDDPLPGRLDHLLAELDGLGQDDLFLGGQQGDLADLLEVHPDRVIDPDHVGRDGLELLGGGLLDLLRVELGGRVGRQLGCRIDRAVFGDDHDPDVGAVLGALRPEIEIVVIVFVVVVTGDGDARLWPRRAQAGELGLFEVRLGATGPRQDGLHELLV